MRKEEFSLQNQFILNVDLKRLYTADTPKFRRGDTVIMLFSFFDDGEEYSLNSATKAMIHQKTSKGNILETECTFVNYNGKRVVRFEVEDVAMVEIGYLNLLLTVWRDKDVISIQPFNVYIYDDYMGGAGSFIELIQELQRQIENMVLDLNNAIKLTEKGVPNGVASLDANGKIPWNQLPSEMDAYIKHIPETVYKNQVHGLRINNDGIMEYESSPNTWTEVGFTEKQGGGSQTLEATVSVVNGIATITYTGIPTVAISKWATGDRVTSHFTLNGTSFTGTTFNVSALGMHTLYYKDSNGIDYVKAFNVTSSMMNKPSLEIDIEDGFVTITPPTSTTISVKKWAKGSQPVSYFIYLGTPFTGDTFEVTEVGTYTIYIKTSTGLEYVYEFNVAESHLQAVGTISTIKEGDKFTFAGKSFVLLEKDNVNGHLVMDIGTKEKRAYDVYGAGNEKFSTTRTTNIGYHLNNSYLNTFPALAKEKIVNSNWGTGVVTLPNEADNNIYADFGYIGQWTKKSNTPISTIKSVEDAIKVSSKVSLLSVSEYRKYSKYIVNNNKYLESDLPNHKAVYDFMELKPTSLLTRTPYMTIENTPSSTDFNSTYKPVMVVDIDSTREYLTWYHVDGRLTLSAPPYPSLFTIFPVMRLHSSTNVDSNQTPTSTKTKVTAISLPFVQGSTETYTPMFTYSNSDGLYSIKRPNGVTVKLNGVTSKGEFSWDNPRSNYGTFRYVVTDMFLLEYYIDFTFSENSVTANINGERTETVRTW